MTKTKRQLRAEAVKRLKDSKPGGVHAAIRQAIGWGWDEMHADGEWRDALVDLLTDDEPPEVDELKAELGKWSDGGEMSEVGKTQDSEIDSEIDTREQLERDIDIWLDRWIAWSIPKDKLWLEIFRWLDRQAAITERECIDTRVNFAERVRLYQNGYKDGSRIGSVRLQSELDEYECKMDALLGRLTNGKWSKTRAYDLDFMKSCVDEEYEMINDGELDALREENSKLKAENDALLAAHADDVERLDAMGEGKLLKQIAELKEELIAEHDYVRREDYDNERKALLDKLVAADDAFKDMKTERDEWKGKALLLEHRLNMELACSDKSIIEALESDNRELAAESKSLKAQRDLFEHDLSETEAKFAEEMAETLSLHSKQQAASHQAWVDAVDERDYWKQEVQYCMDAAYPPSHAPERPYNPHVMDYPPSGAYTTPSTMVSAVIDGLRDEKMAEWKGVFEQLSKAEAERDRYRELASKLLDAAHAMQLIADRGLA